MMSKSRMKYVFNIPTVVPTGRVLVHNPSRHNANTVPGQMIFALGSTYCAMTM